MLTGAITGQIIIVAHPYRREERSLHSTWAHYS